jgi:hypothetical protein
MIPEEIVVTVFPGHCLSSVLCIQSIKKYFPTCSITILIDDFELDLWPSFVNDYKSYIIDQFSDSINFCLYSSLSGLSKYPLIGWIRQQLVKLHLDKMVATNNWLLVDSDVVFNSSPVIDIIPYTKVLASEVDIGNRVYVQNLLGVDCPYLGPENEYWCFSSVPFRYLTRDLLTSLREQVETRHNQSLLDLHFEILKTQHLIMASTKQDTMVMSEFQLIEVFRHRTWHSPLPLKENGAGDFSHDTEKDWKKTSEWAKLNHIVVPDHIWNNLKLFAQKFN